MAKKGTFPCPLCGKDVPAKAKACPHCGSCDKTGWKEEAGDYDGLDLPEENFDYDKFTEEEFGQPQKAKSRQLLWKITAAVLLIIFILLTAFDFLFGT